MLLKIAVLKNFAIFTGNTCVGISFLIKIQVFRPPALLKRDSNTGGFCEHWETFKNTYILKSICERLLLRVSLELFPTWTNNVGSEEDVFSKTKQNKNRSKTQLYEKRLAFLWCSLSFRFFSFSPLHVRRHLPYIINKVLKQLNQWAINPGSMEKLLTHTVHFVLIGSLG